jgi:hypothetical protein
MYIDDINLSGTVGIDEALEQSLGFSVYPNPTGASATIDFRLEDRSDIRIDVLDAAGRVVNRVAESSMDAGEYQFELPANLAGGVYSVRLVVDGYVTSRKVAVVK